MHLPAGSSAGSSSSTHGPTQLPQNGTNARAKDSAVEVGWEQSPFGGLSYSGGEDTAWEIRDVSPGEWCPLPAARQSATSPCQLVRVTQGTMLWENALLKPSFVAAGHSKPPTQASTLVTASEHPPRGALSGSSTQCPPHRKLEAAVPSSGGASVILATCHRHKARELCDEREGGYPNPLTSEPLYPPRQPWGASCAPVSQTNASFAPPAPRRRTKDEQQRG